MDEQMLDDIAKAIWTAPITGQPIGREIRAWPPSDPDALVETMNQARAAHSVIAGKVAELEALVELLREPSKGMLDAGATVADDCTDSDWDSGGDGESYNSYTYLRSDAPATIFAAMVEVALKQAALAPYPERR